MAHRGRLPQYVKIADALRARIRAGAGRGGERLPSEHALRARFKVSRMTVRQALDVLRHEGLLSREVGRGTFAAPTAPNRLRVIGSVEDMLALGDETRFKPLAREPVAAPAEVAAALGVTSGTPLMRFTGIRHGDDGPFQHVTAYVSEAVGRRIADHDLSGTSVIGTVERELGISVKYIEQATEVARCPRAVAPPLGVRAGVPILRLRRTYFTGQGSPIEHAITYHWVERYPYRMMLYRSERARG